MIKNKIIDKDGKGDLEDVYKHNFKKIMDYNKGTFYCNQGSGFCGYEGYSFVDTFDVQFNKKI